jgi:hypothetical protein
VSVWTTKQIRETACQILEERGWSPAGASVGQRRFRPARDRPRRKQIDDLGGSPTRLEFPVEQRSAAEQRFELGHRGQIRTIVGWISIEIAGRQRDRRGGAARSAERSARQAARAQWEAALGRQMAALRQMATRQGPYYESARERSRIVSSAYRAAGSPQRISMRVGPDRKVRWYFARDKYVADPLPAPQADVDRWYAWCRERDRLRKELGSRRGQGNAEPED